MSELAVSAIAGILGFLVASRLSKKNEVTQHHAGGDGGTPIELISGPSVLYVGEYNGVRYILFGDIHTDPTKNVCNVESGCSGYFDNPKNLVKSKGNYSDWEFTADKKPTIIPHSKCYEVSYLLTKIFEIAYSNQKNIDFYFETGLVNRQSRTHREKSNYLSTLRKIDNVFHNCLQLDKRRCKYFPFVKLHYVDVRRPLYPLASMKESTHSMFLIQWLRNWLLNIDTSDITLLFLIISFLKHITTEPEALRLFNIVLNSDNYDSDMKTFITENSRKALSDYQQIKYISSETFDYLTKKFSQVLRHCYDEIIQISKKRNGKTISIIKAQLDSINDQSIAQNIKKYVLENSEYNLENSEMHDETNSILVLFEQYWNTDRLYRGSLLNKINLMKFGVANNVIETNYMDAYLLGRMFRSFSDQESNSNIKIVYAGQFHIERYIEFFKDYLGVDFIKYSSIDKAEEITPSELEKMSVQERKNIEHTLTNSQWKCVKSPFKTIEEFIQPV
jgi:hypothetical protein